MNKSDLSPIENRVLNAIDQHFPDEPEPKFILGVSGGPDSMCLLHIFRQLGVEALVVHINYGKRGAESDKDAELVEQIAFQWGYDCHSLSVDSREAEGKNFQQWARSVRYDIFRSLAKECSASGIAVAHNQDDQIETILQKQFRGAGLASWSGMSEWDGEIFRPLLHTSRREIETYIADKSIPFRTDESNLESDFARNFLRNEWLADLGRHFPGWRQNVLRITKQAALFEEAVDWMSARLMDDRDRISRDGLLSMSTSLRKALILHQLKNLDPDVQISGDTLNELDYLDELQTGKTIRLSDKLRLMRDRQYFKIVHTEPDPRQENVLERDLLEDRPVALGGYLFNEEPFLTPDYEQFLYLDADKLEWPLCLRQWKEGDRFQPFGMEGHQNVSDHLTNRKVSAAEKDRALVLETFEDIICAVIFPFSDNRVPPGTIADYARCDESTRRCLTIKRKA